MGKLKTNYFILVKGVCFCALITIGSAYALGLPDTGQSTCYDNGVEMEECSVTNVGGVSTYPGQDGRFGRDAAMAKGELTKLEGAGDSGFDYRKVCNNGELSGDNNCPVEPVLGVDADDWGCTKDNITGLIWEVKTGDDIPNLRDMNWLYTWYDSDNTRNGGNEGAADGVDAANSADTCFDSIRCDTEKYIADINIEALCGANDWRLPSAREIHTLLHFGKQEPAIDITYFPNTASNVFWSASSVAASPKNTWVVNLGFASDTVQPKSAKQRIRLVRGTKF